MFKKVFSTKMFYFSTSSMSSIINSRLQTKKDIRDALQPWKFSQNIRYWEQQAIDQKQFSETPKLLSAMQKTTKDTQDSKMP